eukprot:3149008-Amphidinium_carterae.1
MIAIDCWKFAELHYALFWTHGPKPCTRTLNNLPFQSGAVGCAKGWTLQETHVFWRWAQHRNNDVQSLEEE